jgi:hypothetical protein
VSFDSTPLTIHSFGPSLSGLAVGHFLCHISIYSLILPPFKIVFAEDTDTIANSVQPSEYYTSLSVHH